MQGSGGKRSALAESHASSTRENLSTSPGRSPGSESRLPTPCDLEPGWQGGHKGTCAVLIKFPPWPSFYWASADIPCPFSTNLGVLGVWQPCSTGDEPRPWRQLGQAGMTLGVTLLPVAFLGDTLPGPSWPFPPSANSTQRGTMGWRLLCLGSAGAIRQECGKHNCFPSPGHGCLPDTAIKGRQIASNCWCHFHVRGRTGRGASTLVGGLQPPSGK